MPTDIDAILSQRAELKKRDPETILLFRVEDGYRAYAEDALQLSGIVSVETRGIRYSGRDPKTFDVSPDSLGAVLDRIVKAGKRAAVCEPVKGPAPAGAKVERVVTEGPTARPCPKLCSECDPSQPHHWLDDSDSLTGFSCKHCEAIGVECVRCIGGGEIEDPIGEEGEIRCPTCGGLGIVEVVAITRATVDRLVAACRMASDALAEDGEHRALCKCSRCQAIDALEAAIREAEPRA